MKWMGYIGLCLVCALCLCGCDHQPQTPSDEGSSTVTPFDALPELDFTKLLTIEQVAQGLDVEVSELDEPIVSDEGTLLRYMSLDYTAQLDVTLQQLSEERRTHALAACAALTAVPNLGEQAFVDDNGILYVFFRDYVMNIYVEKAEMSDDRQMSVSRHFAALVMDAVVKQTA